MTIFGFLWLVLVHAIAFAAVALVALDAWERYSTGRDIIRRGGR